MKIIKKIVLLFAVINMSIVIMPPKASAQAVSVNFQMFYSNLSPYGRWVNYGTYGQCWIPKVGVGFRPYFTKGHWVYADIGWTWYSGYPWGWAPFHYGRWVLDPAYGWLWVPGYDWGPAWVSWRHAEGYYGWTPLEPGISINIALGAGYVVPHDRWIFVQDRYIGDPHFHRYYLHPDRNDDIFRHSMLIRDTHMDNRTHETYFAGPNRTDVERVSGNRISPVAIHNNRTPGQTMSNGHLWLYKPDMNGNRTSTGATVNSNPQTKIGNLKNGNTRSGQTIQPNRTSPGNTRNFNKTPHPAQQREQHSGNRKWK